MKKRVIIFLSFLSVIILLNFTSALLFQPVDEDIKINSLEQRCSIENTNDLYCNVVVGFFIINKTKPDISFDIHEGLGTSVIFYNKSISLCNWGDNYQDSVNPYLNFNLSCYPELPLKKEFPRFDKLIIKINSTLLDNKIYNLFFNYTIKNFVIQDPLYNTIFFNVYLNSHSSNDTFIVRNIILPKNSVIDVPSLYNFR
ncbi:MAG: hypothetical protein AABX99_01965 [Nanoarchaeota archaeon]